MNGIQSDINQLKALTGRTPIFLYGAKKKTTTNASHSLNNRLNSYDYNFIEAVVCNKINLPKIGSSGCDLFVQSSGGSFLHAVAIIDKLKKVYSDDVNIIIPSWSKSAATLMAVSGKSLYIDASAMVSDIFNVQAVNTNQLIGMMRHAGRVINSGTVVQSADIKDFLLLNVGLSKVTGHTAMSFNQFDGVCKQYGLALSYGSLADLDSRENDFSKGTEALVRKIDHEINQYMIKHSTSKLNIFSDIEHNIFI